ncbi:MAG: DUF711 family protein [Chloroflexi bacterium]|nr:DUF711 family protein [Chloroflexota bacterium]
MQVRAVTVGQRVSFPLRPGPVHRAARFASAAKAAFEDAGYEVQSLRLATQPISDILRRKAPADAPALARELEAAAGSGGVDYCSLGPVLASGGEDATSLIGQIPDILAATEGVFVSVMAATTRDGVNLATVRAAAEALVRIGKLDAEGAASRRFALTANVQPNGPFFPSAYHRGRGPGFSIAIEAADLAVEAFRDARVKRVVVLGLDGLEPTIAEKLLAAGFKAGIRTFWIWEGVTMYLEEEAVRTTLELVCSLSAPGALLAFDAWCPPDSGLQRIAHRDIPSLAMRLVYSEPFVWAPQRDSLDPFLRELGLALIEAIPADELVTRYTKKRPGLLQVFGSNMVLCTAEVEREI